MATILTNRGPAASAAFGSAGRGLENFPNPFLDLASLSMPDQHRNVMEWVEYIFNQSGTYRMAMERVIAYFLTDVELGPSNPRESLGEDERDKYTSFYNETLDIKTVLQTMDRDQVCYGNAFAMLVVPFRRYLVCPGCGNQHPLAVVFENPKFKFKWGNFEFSATCPGCEYSGVWTVNDQPEDEEQKIKVKLWNPKEIEIINDYYTGDCAYLWKIPEQYRKDIISGNLYHLERAPLQVIKAIKHNWYFRFAPDVIYHMKEQTLGGMPNRGWGISRVLTNFRQVWYVQVLKRYNEAIALDYVIPFRLLTPVARAGTGAANGQTIDPLLTTNMGDFMGQVRQMVRKRRRDPAGWHTLPFPVQYQALGGDASQLAPRELIDQGIDEMLNASGTPVEMYKGTLQVQAAPSSMRLFEATWSHLVHGNNRFLRWLTQQISQVLSWEMVSATMRRVTFADDMERQVAMLQLMMGQAISQTTGLKQLGLDRKTEIRQIAEEAREQQEIQAEIQEEMEQAAFGQQLAAGAPGVAGTAGGGAAPPPGGAAPAPAGGDPAAAGAPALGPVSSMFSTPGAGGGTPQDIMAQAESIANQLLGLPESQKDSELRMLKQKNEILHSVVRAKMDQIRQQAQTAGGAMLLGQQGAAPQGAAA